MDDGKQPILFDTNDNSTHQNIYASSVGGHRYPEENCTFVNKWQNELLNVH